MQQLTVDTFDDFIGSQTKPILVDLWADFCGPCKQLMPILEELSESHSDKFVIASVDVMKEMAIADMFKVITIPTVILFSPSGLELTRFIGYQNKAKILDKIGKHI